MLRRVAMLLLTCGASAYTFAAAPSSEQPAQRAVQTLMSHLSIAESDITVVRTESHTWPDSSLGCGKPGNVAMQVITEGHVVMLAAQGKQYRVHVANGRAVVCDKPVIMRKELRRPANARGLDEAVQRAKEDLAKRIGADVAQVRLVRTQSHQWANNGLDCPRADETLVDTPVAGFRILLEHSSRTYTYHTDLRGVRPCPAIEAM